MRMRILLLDSSTRVVNLLQCVPASRHSRHQGSSTTEIAHLTDTTGHSEMVRHPDLYRLWPVRRFRRLYTGVMELLNDRQGHDVRSIIADHKVKQLKSHSEKKIYTELGLVNP